jgi:putative ABC transport system substrate-binding protein
MASSGDPVLSGLVVSLAQPGGNVTGYSTRPGELEGKRLELLKRAAPKVSRVAVLWNPDNRTSHAFYQHTQIAAKTLRVTLQPAVDVRRVADFEHAFATIAGARPNALVVLPDRLLLAHRRRIVDFAAHNRLPAMYPYREYVDGGGFMSYGTRYTDLFRAVATFVDKILKPADIPVQQATNFEFIINLKAAKALGLTIPPSLLGRADEVIQ